MTTIRIWAVESDYDAKAVECLATKLAKHLQLGNLSIQVSGKTSFNAPQIFGKLDDERNLPQGSGLCHFCH